VNEPEWVWSKEHHQPVRVLEKLEVWGKTTFVVFVPTENAVRRVAEDAIVPLERRGASSLNEIVYAAAAARVSDTLAQDILIAPLGSSLLLLPHQIYALSRAISGDRIRYLLADEVGLGKTIEAGMIMRELKLRGLVERTLIVVPKGLVRQWAQEMRLRFGEEFELVEADMLAVVRHLSGESNFWRRFRQVICSMDSVKPIEGRRGWSREDTERYNRERFHDLVAAGWDLVIVDEAHKLAGSVETVARHQLGKGLANAAPYFLLLSATPHQGKTEAFQRLMSLLDQEAFPDAVSIAREQVARYVIRTHKRQAIDEKGKPLFKPRTTELVPVEWEKEHTDQRWLYEAVTEYVREGYNQALRERRNYLGFLMVLMQRLVTSSTRAIRTALERRRAVIEQEAISASMSEPEFGAEWWEMDGQEQLEQLLSGRLASFGREREEIRKLIELAAFCEQKHPDAKAEALVDRMYRLRQEEQDPDLKFLVFTEFIPTQEMLREFLESRGFSVVCLNGLMEIDERLAVQEKFSSEAEVLVSTEAGGEGLNLQFCHVVINYDLPWNPMRIEQRIGRVDRIGQEHPVKALNLLFQDTVEHRVQEVLEEKLATILSEFGVDKTSDVLDSARAEADFDNLYMRAIANPEVIDEQVERLIQRIREEVQDAQEGRSLFGEASFDATVASSLANHPIGFWIERMTTSFLMSRGGEVSKDLFNYDLAWPDGTRMRKVTFGQGESPSSIGKRLTLESPRIRELLNAIPQWAPEQAIPVISLRGLPGEVAGYWLLWRVGLIGGEKSARRILALFRHDDGRVLLPTSKRIWDLILQEGDARVMGEVGHPESGRVFRECEELARKEGQDLFRQLERGHKERVERERRKKEYAFRVRKEAVMRIGLPAVREHRLSELRQEEEQWRATLNRLQEILPELTAVMILRVEGMDA